MPAGASLDRCCQCCYLCAEPLPTHTSAGDPLMLAGRSGSASCGVTAPFPRALMHPGFCVCPPGGGASVSPGPLEICSQILQVRFPGD